VIVLDTHIWVWWVHNETQLNDRQRELIREHEDEGLGVSIFSCWEVAKLVELERLSLHCSIDEWLETALQYPGVQLLALTPEIVVESTQLRDEFHRDPADQLIVATARIYDCPLLTVDDRILKYPHVKLLK
jgi:PIN domain nuclease of toxin-antitoxin system